MHGLHYTYNVLGNSQVNKDLIMSVEVALYKAQIGQVLLNMWLSYYILLDGHRQIFSQTVPGGYWLR